MAMVERWQSNLPHLITVAAGAPNSPKQEIGEWMIGCELRSRPHTYRLHQAYPFPDAPRRKRVAASYNSCIGASRTMTATPSAGHGGSDRRKPVADNAVSQDLGRSAAPNTRSLSLAIPLKYAAPALVASNRRSSCTNVSTALASIRITRATV
jgi:hypothetical protein